MKCGMGVQSSLSGRYTDHSLARVESSRRGHLSGMYGTDEERDSQVGAGHPREKQRYDVSLHRKGGLRSKDRIQG